MTSDFSDILVTESAPSSDDVPSQRQGTALCLSGGGYRAMLFHAGALLRLNELGLLAQLDVISSVSGGSIAAGLLARGWPHLHWSDGVADNLDAQVISPLMQFAGITVDRSSIVAGLLRPRRSIGEQVARAYRRHLFADMSTRDLPDRPRFIFTATNLQSGALWRFSKPYMRDWRVGEVRDPDVPMAQVVAASAAFPPVLSPVRLRVGPADWSPEPAELGRPEFRRDVILSDGGVYDNLALEPVIKRCATILVSDGGGRLSPSAVVAQTWARHTKRVLSVIDQQVRSLRSRALIAGYRRGDYMGAYWGIRTPIERYGMPDSLVCSSAQTMRLAETPTRLAALSETDRRRLANWGYAVCDAALRRHVLVGAQAPAEFPWPDAGIGRAPS
jgi:NTE family protein